MSPTLPWGSWRTCSTPGSGRVYSGIRRGPGASTKFQVSVARLRNIQVFVVGDVVRPGAYQISAAGTVAHRPLRGWRPDRERQLSQGGGAPGRQAGRFPRHLRLPAARHQSERHPAGERRRRLRPGARRLRQGGRGGHPASRLRAAPGRDPARPDRVRRRLRSRGLSGAGADPPDPAAETRGVPEAERGSWWMSAPTSSPAGACPAVPMAAGRFRHGARRCRSGSAGM